MEYNFIISLKLSTLLALSHPFHFRVTHHKSEKNLSYTYMKSFVIVCEPLARALNSTPIKSVDAGYFHSISFPSKEKKIIL